jgi:hypothetical protein
MYAASKAMVYHISAQLTDADSLKLQLACLLLSVGEQIPP